MRISSAPAEIAGLTSGRVIFEDSADRIWIGTNDNGLIMMEDGKTRHYTYKDGLPASSVRAIAEYSRGNIIVGTTSGLCYIDISGRVMKLDSEHINTKTVTRLVSDRNGFVYGCTGEGDVFAVKNCAVSEEDFFAAEFFGNDRVNTFLRLTNPNLPGGSISVPRAVPSIMVPLELLTTK